MTDEVAALRSLARAVGDHTLYAAAARLAHARHEAVWVVGGTVRDALLGRPWHDLDLALEAELVLPFARALATETSATLVPLDDRLPTVRVVAGAGDGRVEVDLSGLRGAGIAGDLAARDLTVNALAVSLEELGAGGVPAIVDPTGGIDDLRRAWIRVPSPSVLADDPLRVLRAHRFAATLGFTIEPRTREALRAHAGALASAAAERIRDELFKLLGAPGAGARLTDLWEDGLLGVILPEVEAMDGVTQNTFHHLDVLHHTLEACRAFDEVCHDPGRFFGDHGSVIEAYLAEGPNAALVLLSVLLHDVAKPATRVVDESGVHFYRHEAVGAEMTEAICARLRLSNRHTDTLVRWVAQHLGLKDLILLHRERRLVDRTVRRFLRRAGEDLAGLLSLVLADTRATRGPDFPPDAEVLLLDVCGRLLDEDRVRRADPSLARPLLRGRDLIEELGLAPGPLLGELLAAVEEARLDGTLRGRDDALAWLRARLQIG
ncbi:MAG: HD domain-containing protein [Deltaproteobacteria bacterium]|nr:HD domain-containing protein [Deltaproteobacteria bacterium]